MIETSLIDIIMTSMALLVAFIFLVLIGFAHKKEREIINSNIIKKHESKRR